MVKCVCERWRKRKLTTGTKSTWKNYKFYRDIKTLVAIARLNKGLTPTSLRLSPLSIASD